MNKIIYIGMDVHSSNFTLCSFEPGYGIEADKIFGQTQIKEDIFNSTVKYINKLKSMRPDVDVVCGYEAGCFYNHSIEELSLDELKTYLSNYIQWYNNDRIKNTLGGLSPVQYRLRFG